MRTSIVSSWCHAGVMGYLNPEVHDTHDTKRCHGCHGVMGIMRVLPASDSRKIFLVKYPYVSIKHLLCKHALLFLFGWLVESSQTGLCICE